VGIPAKANADSGRNANAFRAEDEQFSERSGAGISIVREVFAFVKGNLSGAKRRKSTASGEKGAGKGAAALVPPQHTETRSVIRARPKQIVW
jgi:hypothetical protein